MTLSIIDSHQIGLDSTLKLDPSVSNYVAAFSQDSRDMISNVDSHMKLLVDENTCLPISINNTEYDNSYVCSPYTALISYAFQESDKINNPVIRGIIKSINTPLGNYLKHNQINKIICINNWMLSTNLYPASWQGDNLAEIISILTSSNPNHSIMFRSLNKYTNKPLIDSLTHHGFLLVPSRQVYIYDQQHSINQTRDYKKDIKLLKTTPFQYVPPDQIISEDIPRITELYRMLYINKYSIHNPLFSESYISMLLQNDLFHAEGFRNSDGVLDAIGIRFTRDGVTSVPVVGYDTSRPQSLGLYRLINISTSKWVYENNILFNASSGASKFKMFRGASPYIEYSAIYINHLPKSVQRMWKGLALALEHLIVPIMKKYQL